MANNTELNLGSGGDTYRSIDKTGVKTQVVTLDVGGSGAESLVSGTVPVSGTVTANLSATDNAVLDSIDAAVNGTVAVSNAGLTELAAAINASSQMDVNIAASAATVAVSNAGITTIAGAVSGTEMQVDVVGALPAGANAIGKLAANSGVDIGDVDVTSVVPGSGATNLGKAEDAGHTTGDVGVMALAIRDDTLGATSGAELDYEPLHTDKDGALWVQPKVSDCLDEALSNTDGNSTASTVFGATASNRNYITAVSVFRSDAGATLAYVDFRDGTSGSVIWRMPLPPNGGSVMSSDKPLFKTTANTALAFDVSAALTTVYISLSGFKAP